MIAEREASREASENANRRKNDYYSCPFLLAHKSLDVNIGSINIRILGVHFCSFNKTNSLYDNKLKKFIYIIFWLYNFYMWVRKCFC